MAYVTSLPRVLVLNTADISRAGCQSEVFDRDSGATTGAKATGAHGKHVTGCTRISNSGRVTSAQRAISSSGANSDEPCLIRKDPGQAHSDGAHREQDGRGGDGLKSRPRRFVRFANEAQTTLSRDAACINYASGRGKLTVGSTYLAANRTCAARNGAGIDDSARGLKVRLTATTG
jgi:hypothetical protein